MRILSGVEFTHFSLIWIFTSRTIWFQNWRGKLIFKNEEGGEGQ